jgi:hypothetical protein
MKVTAAALSLVFLSAGYWLGAGTVEALRGFLVSLGI